MTDQPEPDPIAAAFRDYRATHPRDIVPKSPHTGSNADLAALHGQTVEMTHVEWSDDGPEIIRTTTAITRPVGEDNRYE